MYCQASVQTTDAPINIGIFDCFPPISDANCGWSIAFCAAEQQQLRAAWGTMRTMKRRVMASAACLLITVTAAHADELDRLQQELEHLEQRAQALRMVDRPNWLKAQRSYEVEALVRHLLDDAAWRASCVNDGLTAGHDGNFYIASRDNTSRLTIAGLAQVRNVYNHQSAPGNDGDRHRSGFENRRTQGIFSGHIIDPSWRYRIHGDFGRDGTFSTLDLYVEKHLPHAWVIRAGQFRPRLLLEDLTSSGRQLTAERSLINATFRQGWTQGVQLAGDLGQAARMTVGYYDGIPSTSGTFTSGIATPWNMRTSQHTLIGSVELLLAGQWSQLRDMTSWSDDPFGAVIGGALVWQRDAHGTDDDVTELVRWTIDASVHSGGASVFAAMVGNHESTRGNGSVDQYGLVVQGGVHLVPDAWEVFARYEWGHSDGMGRDLSVLTTGVNRYLARNTLKVTTDIGYGFNEVAPFWAAQTAGWRADAAGERGQIVVRSQLQFFF